MLLILIKNMWRTAVSTFAVDELAIRHT